VTAAAGRSPTSAAGATIVLVVGGARECGRNGGGGCAPGNSSNERPLQKKARGENQQKERNVQQRDRGARATAATTATTTKRGRFGPSLSMSVVVFAVVVDPNPDCGRVVRMASSLLTPRWCRIKKL
jgi:hypothetical protein